MEDDLTDFIADCEWKTRKILRDSNKRRSDSARLHAAKERVEQLKQKGVKSKKPQKSSSQNVKPPFSKGEQVSSTPKEWKHRDKIIHDACETIKSLDSNQETRIAKKGPAESKIHASLCASPFNDGKGSIMAPTSAKKAVSKRTKDSRESNGEPAVITRRTIERDFYIMSKKRSQPKKRRQKSAKKGEAKPELKPCALWKKYRCVDRVMEAKSREAKKLQDRFERLQPFNGDSADEADASSDSESSSEGEEPKHALHELINKHVAKENLRSQRRTEKMLMQIKFKPDVQAMWDKLEEGNGKIIPRNISATKGCCQIQSISLKAATHSFIEPSENASTWKPKPTDSLQKKEGIQYVPPYEEPIKILHLICNEPLTLDSNGDSVVPLTVSISYEYKPRSESPPMYNGSWIYEVYSPYNGSMRTYRLNDDEFNHFVSRCKAQSSGSVETKVLRKIVHQQEVEIDDSRLLHVVVILMDTFKISSEVYRSKASYMGGLADLDSLDDAFERVCSLRAAQVLQLLDKQRIYSAFADAFWMDEGNGAVIWTPLMDLVFKGGMDTLGRDVSLRSASAHDSLVAAKQLLATDGSKSIDHIMNAFKQSNAEASESIGNTPLLSMQISNHSPYSSTICPGHTATGRRGVWRLTQPIVEEQANTVFPMWLTDAKYPSHLDKTQASIHLYHKNLGPQKGTCVTTLSRLAFESPIFSPYCYAADTGYIIPPFSQPEIVDGTIPTVDLQCKSLLEHPVQSRFDTLLPPTIVVLDPGASEGDWIDAPRDSNGNVYHVRNKDQFNRDGFRIKTFAHRIEYDDTVRSMVYGISEKAAIPNSPATAPFLRHKSTECCTEYLSRKRTASDYHHIAESDGEGTLSIPYLFATHMKDYKPVHISRKSITSYRDEKQFLLATREAEAKKAEISLKIKAAEELAEARLKEKIEQIHQSMKLTTQTPNKAINLPSAVKKSTTPTEPETTVDELKPESDQGDDEVDELDQMANMLLNNTNFLRAIARKLNIPEGSVSQVEQASSTAGAATTSDSHLDELKPEEPKHRSPVVPKLDLTRKTYNGDIIMGLKGDGWKRLPRTDTLVGEFKLTTRKVEKNRNGAKFDGFEGRRNFFAVNAVGEIRHEVDPKIYGIKTSTMFISDLTTERLRLSKSQRRQKQYEKSLLSEDQQFSLKEILQIPVESNRPGGQKMVDVDDGVDVAEDEGELLEEPEGIERSTEHGLDPTTRAILAVKHHNMQHLEHVLDTEALPIETRDQHGNTLFILACQQGSKRLAKFLLRRGADINAQNNSGNTALHYLHEYHHKLLAEYLERKGADNSIRNAIGLSVYEGVNLGDND